MFWSEIVPILSNSDTLRFLKDFLLGDSILFTEKVITERICNLLITFIATLVECSVC